MIEQVEAILPPWSLLAAAVCRSRRYGGRRRGGPPSPSPTGGRRRPGPRGRRGPSRRRKVSAGTLAAALAFVVCTSVSLNTSYRFTLDGLGMTGTAERVLSCAAFEALIAMCVLGARERLASQDATPGWYGSAVWLFAALSSVPAWHEGGGLTAGTVVRIIVGSIGSALSAHAALGLELRHRTGGRSQSQSPGALIVREVRERVMARLGLIERGRDAEQIIKDRYLDRAIELADEQDHLTEADRNKRHGRKVCRRLAQAMDRGGCADPERRETFNHRLALRRAAATLPDVDLPLTWQAQPTPEEQATTAHLEREIRHVEALAAQIEGQATHELAHPEGIGTPLGTVPAQQAGPHGHEADEDQDEPVGARTAAYEGTGTHRITMRVPIPHEADEDQDQGDKAAPEAPDLRGFQTKRAALRALFVRHQVAADDPRTHNQIATELLQEMQTAGIPYDRGAACKAISEWRQLAQDKAPDRELTHV
ncbi:hypothetical protein IHE61_31170 [Streptomyces sp. GKU 257-1]|nr:hypothetical protein [Streptomyces sp. GKU 257-1]